MRTSTAGVTACGVTTSAGAAVTAAALAELNALDVAAGGTTTAPPRNCMRPMDSRVRAIDVKTGDVLWKHVVPAPAAAMPAIYQYKGKQYVLFVAGGNPILGPKAGDEAVAFTLP